MTDTPEFEERENGPLVVKDLHSMTDAGGRTVEVKPVMALCRCGHSGSKPFCDGSHKRVGFASRGGEPAGRDRVITYAGAEVSVHYNPRICSHAAECARIAPKVFDSAAKPWVQPDNGSRAEIEAVVRACPSGALRLSDPGGAPEHGLDDARAEVQVQRDGPYWVHDVTAPAPPQAEGMSARKYVLCRCGLSGTKPFCDGTHRDAGWVSGD